MLNNRTDLNVNSNIDKQKYYLKITFIKSFYSQHEYLLVRTHVYSFGRYIYFIYHDIDDVLVTFNVIFLSQ